MYTCYVASLPSCRSQSRGPSRSSQLAFQVAALDRLLGRTALSVADLLLVQKLVMRRQRCAQRALEGAASSATRCPGYLVNPIASLWNWPRRYADAPSRDD